MSLLLGMTEQGQATPSDDLWQRLQPAGRVNDFAQCLSAADRLELEQAVASLEATSGVQVAVVMLKSLEGGQIDDVAEKLFIQWGIGEKGKDNGLLILAALEDRAARIEVGYGLEPRIPDALAGRILDEQVFPAFREGRYGAGMLAAVRRVGDILGGRDPERPITQPKGGFQMVLVAGVFVLIGGFMLGAGLGARVAAMVLIGLVFSAIPILMVRTVSEYAALGEGVLAAAIAVVGFRMGRKNPKAFEGGSAGSGRPGGWNLGPGSRGGGGSFGGGGGGFGGGRSGGGGASGRW